MLDNWALTLVRKYGLTVVRDDGLKVGNAQCRMLPTHGTMPPIQAPSALSRSHGEHGPDK
ncbi:MAG: hypothetical protein C4K60_12605 [Ideonella sp. MAG2]|nr:MAG: hypothetical protein C4K60_12605 [Ideonella sp. MAG2]